jgi:branched-subunit amino acid aminotransferase/4-amino-4-deoxychorismate lyase
LDALAPAISPRACILHAGLQLGWSVFDTCNVENGLIYGLDFHIERIFHSMSLAKIGDPL